MISSSLLQRSKWQLYEIRNIKKGHTQLVSANLSVEFEFGERIVVGIGCLGEPLCDQLL